MMSFRIDNKNLEIYGNKVGFEYPIEEVILFHDRYLVLLDPDAFTRKWGQFQNLICINPKGDKIWIAELPTSTTGDCYHTLEIIDDRINAYSWCSYKCFINPETGKIIEKNFTK